MEQQWSTEQEVEQYVEGVGVTSLAPLGAKWEAPYLAWTLAKKGNACSLHSNQPKIHSPLPIYSIILQSFCCQTQNINGKFVICISLFVCEFHPVCVCVSSARVLFNFVSVCKSLEPNARVTIFRESALSMQCPCLRKHHSKQERFSHCDGITNTKDGHCVCLPLTCWTKKSFLWFAYLATNTGHQLDEADIRYGSLFCGNVFSIGYFSAVKCNHLCRLWDSSSAADVSQRASGCEYRCNLETAGLAVAILRVFGIH